MGSRSILFYHKTGIDLTRKKHDSLNPYMHCKITTMNFQAHKIILKTVESSRMELPHFSVSVKLLLADSFCHLLALVTRQVPKVEEKQRLEKILFINLV